jgi:hypothetical protein
MPGFNPFSFGSSSKGLPQPQYPVLKPPFNPSRAPGGGVPPAWMQPAQGPEMPQPPDPSRPPPPPDPSLIPPMPQMGPPQMASQMGPPRAAPVPNEGDGGLSMPPGGGMKDPFSQMNDEQMKSIIGLGNMPQEMSQLDSQIAQSEALRGRGMPEGRDSGRVYTAASPLEFGGELMKQYAAKRELQGGPERLGGLIKAQSGLYNDRKAMLDKATGTRKSFFDLVRGQSGGL